MFLSFFCVVGRLYWSSGFYIYIVGILLMLLSKTTNPFMPTVTHRRRSPTCRATASTSGAVRVRHFAQGHLNIQLGGAGDRTSNLPATSQPALPPQLSQLLWLSIYRSVPRPAIVASVWFSSPAAFPLEFSFLPRYKSIVCSLSIAQDSAALS